MTALDPAAVKALATDALARAKDARERASRERPGLVAESDRWIAVAQAALDMAAEIEVLAAAWRARDRKIGGATLAMAGAETPPNVAAIVAKWGPK